ncbi:Cys-tRNA(Pro) deacylase [Calidifontibacter indicus]|uniref:Cys-tRNA(Pro)/Cys-tRNA(Cys) deacylase n=1 Tax=Calidifontibacter indicus TaxID=419650 RepID=A0A3D9UX52_9MICO|nr:Cys-tRNA(Pro) deacylase [Calidifontibacter indicus]REF31165.1 Cys-tRNA(Pro)/Cys-tRNA(Cys) deacylase [Calidifontibacter indicus]
MGRKGRGREGVEGAATPATRVLTQAAVEFSVHPYEHDPRADSYGLEAAEALGLQPAEVFKTLVAQTDSDRDHGLVVAVVPVDRQVDLKALAAAVGAKKAAMAPVPLVERTTGYVVGGVSPVGQKRPLRTVVDASAQGLPRMYVSGGRRGFDIGLSPADLVAVVDGRFAPISR